MLKLKLQYFGHLMGRTDSFEKTLILGKIEGRRRRGRQSDRGWDGWMAPLTQWTWVWVNSGNWQWIERPGVLQSMGLQRVRHDWATELNWTEWQKTSGTKQPLGEGERGEWKSLLKTQHSKNEDHGIRSHHFMRNRWGNSGNSARLCFFVLENHCIWWLQPWN